MDRTGRLAQHALFKAPLVVAPNAVNDTAGLQVRQSAGDFTLVGPTRAANEQNQTKIEIDDTVDLVNQAWTACSSWFDLIDPRMWRMEVMRER